MKVWAWKECDDRFIKENAGKISAADMAAKLGRTRGAVYNRAYQLKTNISYVHKRADNYDVELARQLYEDHGLMQKDIAEKLGVSRRVVSDWVRYKTR